jgi:large subunit ribosomal protein L3
MTQVYAENGQAVPVTVLDVSPSTVLQVKTTQTDGYEAIQVGYGRKKIHRAKRANQVRAEKAGLDTAPVRIQEFRTDDASHYRVGDKIGADFFVAGDLVKVSGKSKGRGFTGVMKRHGFAGGTRKSHGGGPSHRGVGSAGMSATPARTPKGRKLAGQYGNAHRTVLNLTVFDVDSEEQLLLIMGAIPGPVNGLVTVELVGDAPREYTPQNRAAAPEQKEEAEAGEEADTVPVEEVAGEAVEEPAEVEVADEDDAAAGDEIEEATAEDTSEDTAEESSEDTEEVQDEETSEDTEEEPTEETSEDAEEEQAGESSEDAEEAQADEPSDEEGESETEKSES